MYGILKFFKKQYACACIDRPPKEMRNVRIGARIFMFNCKLLKLIAPVVTSINPQIIAEDN